MLCSLYTNPPSARSRITNFPIYAISVFGSPRKWFRSFSWFFFLYFSIHKLDWWFHGLFINSARRSDSIRQKKNQEKKNNYINEKHKFSWPCTTSFLCRARRSRAPLRTQSSGRAELIQSVFVIVCIVYAFVCVCVFNLSVKLQQNVALRMRNGISATAYGDTHTHVHMLNGRALYNLQNWRLHLILFLPIPFFFSHAVTHNVTYLSTRARMCVCVAFVVVSALPQCVQAHHSFPTLALSLFLSGRFTLSLSPSLGDRTICSK